MNFKVVEARKAWCLQVYLLNWGYAFRWFFVPNLHYRKFWVESESRWVRLRVSAKAIRIIDKKGIDDVLVDLRSRGEKV
jgi:hypothetical protein